MSHPIVIYGDRGSKMLQNGARKNDAEFLGLQPIKNKVHTEIGRKTPGMPRGIGARNWAPKIRFRVSFNGCMSIVRVVQ